MDDTFKKNYKLFEFIIANTQLNLIVLDAKFNITFVTKHFQKKYRNDILHQNLFDYFQEDLKRDYRLEEIKNLSAYNNFLLIQGYRHNRLGEERILDCYCYYLDFDFEQKILIEIREHTETDGHKQNLKEQGEVSGNKNRLILLGETIAGIAHEINNPLTSILTNAQLLNRKITCIETERIAKEAMRIAKIIKNLLSFSRHSQNVQGVINVKAELEDVLLLINTKINENVTLKLNIDKDAAVFGDAVEFSQIFINLIRNAIAALEKSEEKIIEINVTALEDIVKISISDTGCGIPQKYLKKIFEPFFTTKRIGEGTGLGLAMVFYLVNKMGGKIQVASQENQGTNFTIVFPKYQKTLNVKDYKGRIDFKDKKILIIDDEYPMLREQKEMLEREDCLVTIENDPVKGIQILMDNFFDLILIDLNLSLVNGLELYKVLGSFGYDVNKIFLMTERKNFREMEEISQTYNCKFIPKSFTVEELKCCILEEWGE
ncbi:MAG: hybrid sensor histidine kinase/response regulator [Peptococcaceae bacterium]